jgi:23S rRNA (adenine1618-N6)-methyltransferase
MLGKLSSLQQIVAKLKGHDINNFAVTCLQAGHKTKRWAIAWSFQDLRPRNDVSRHGDLVHAVLPPPTAQTIALPLMTAEMAGSRIDTTLKDLDVRWQWRPAIATGVMEAKENTWGRAARRKKKFGRVATEDRDGNTKDEDESEQEDPVAIAVKVICKKEEVEVRWLRGLDHIMFQSLCGFLKRALTGQA